MGFNIAIDGPAGAGKSTIARALAEKLAYIYVDTGAMYRAMALYLLRNGISAEDGEKIHQICDNIEISIAHEEGVQKIYLNGEDVSEQIRREEVGNMASKSAANPYIREKLVDLQRQLAARENVVMDGRDIGTCVLPNADVKIYLTASVHVRALRRYNEYLSKGMEADLEQIEKDIAKRDEQDMTRKISPLKRAEDAHLLDSSEMNIEEVLDAMTALCARK